jgi:uncharacterized protein
MPLPQFDASVVSRLACPACYGSLRHENSHLICAACGRAYPIIDGVPVLIAARAEAEKESPANG